MTKNKPIFDLRFSANEELSPSPPELEFFLGSPKMDGSREQHGNDLARYRAMLTDVQAFEQHQFRSAAPWNARDTMFYGVLSSTHFFSPVLASEVAQYKYHLHTLLTLDFKKPKAFIASAEDAMRRLNPRYRDDADRLARLRAMVAEREKNLDTLVRQQAALVRELGDIAHYIRKRLAMIEKRCEASIVVLVELHLSRKMEKELIGEIKTHFREQLRDSLHDGPVTKQYVETVKNDVAQLAKELSSMIRDDIFDLTGLLETVHDHAEKTALEIETLTAKTGRGGNKSIEDDLRRFSEVEKVLVSLVSEYGFELQPAVIHSQTAHEDILQEKRMELLDDVIELLQKERRTRLERRFADDRRTDTALYSAGPDRRTGKNRRSGKKRR